MNKQSSIDNAEFILRDSNPHGVCSKCTPYNLRDNEYEYCFYCKMVLRSLNKCNKAGKSEMAKAYLNNTGLIKNSYPISITGTIDISKGENNER